MPASQADLYRFHVENLRTVGSALTQVSRSVKDALKSGNEAAHETYKPLYIMLCGVWAECRFQKLLHEPGVNTTFRSKVYSESSQIDRWNRLIQEAFRLHYGVPAKKELSAQSMGFTQHSRFTELKRLLDDELRPIIELRNKLAHGQWEYPLNNTGNNVEQSKLKDLKKIPYIDYYFKSKFLDRMSNIIETLVLSKATFDRDFDSNYGLLLNDYEDWRRINPSEWVDSLKKRYENGKTKRKANMSGGS